MHESDTCDGGTAVRIKIYGESVVIRDKDDRADEKEYRRKDQNIRAPDRQLDLGVKSSGTACVWAFRGSRRLCENLFFRTLLSVFFHGGDSFP